jgi:hypothetical protein
MPPEMIEQLQALSKKPAYGSDAYKQWLTQEDMIRFLQELPRRDEIVLYAIDHYLYLYAVLVPSRLLNPPDKNDLDRWGCNPSSSWGIGVRLAPRKAIWLAPPLHDTGTRTLAHGEQILFARNFDGRQEQQSYVEIAQRLTHLFDLHYVPERHTYARFDTRGDIQDIIHVFDNGMRAVTIRREVMDEYLTLTKQSLVLLFDSTRVDMDHFSAWGQRNLRHAEHEPGIYYHADENPGNASYIRGFQIIHSRLKKKDVLSRHENPRRQYTTFLALDWKHKTVHECSCDPKRLGNYFVQSDLPYETSPVFFRPEVLQKYKADPTKYTLGDRRISCRHAWSLQTYDTNEAEQVHTYLKYLGDLPYEEQLYWKSFNEPPKGTISKRAFITDFEGSWNVPYDPLTSLRGVLRELHEARVQWWTLRDDTLLDQVHYPLTTAPREWASELHTLDKLLIEGLETSALRSTAQGLGRSIDKDWKSIKLTEETLRGMQLPEDQIREIIAPLQELATLRNKLGGHTQGKQARQLQIQALKDHGTYCAHFRALCQRCDQSLRALRDIFGTKPCDEK